MARVAKTTTAPAKPTPPARKTASRVTTPAKKIAAAPVEVPSKKPTRGAGKPGRPALATTRKMPPAPLAATPAPKLSKDELRAQVAKLEASNATLRTKSRDMNRAMKAATSRVAELEAEVATLHEQAAAAQVAPEPAEAPKAPRRTRAARKAAIDPGDAVPPGVAVEEAQPLDEEATAARDALEENLSAG